MILDDGVGTGSPLVKAIAFDMRIIEIIDAVMQKHKEDFAKIEDEFNRQNEKFRALLFQDHDILGRTLKFHLITECYINEYLQCRYPDINFAAVDLRYFQKLQMLSTNDPRIEFITPGLKELNKIRNKFGHNLDTSISIRDLPEMLEVLSIARKGANYTAPERVIEEFTTIACTFLIVSPKEIDELFRRVFSELK